MFYLYLLINVNQPDALNFYNKFISSLYMFRAHVLIVRRAKLYYAVSGIITHCRWPSGENIFLYFANRASQYIYLNINQLDALNFYNKFISCLYMFRAHVLIVRRAKIVLYSLWYHHTETSEWSKITKIIKII